MKITNEDNLQLMARYTDNYFDLAFIDPPYGIKAARPTTKPDRRKQKNGTFLSVKRAEYGHKSWDDQPASSCFGSEIFRVSKNQAIWGANHLEWIVGKTFKPPRRDMFNNFVENNPIGWIVWNKLNGDSDQWDCELLWTSYDFPSFIIPYMWHGMLQGSIEDGSKMQGNKKLNEKRSHPTQKPVRIYEKVYHFLSTICLFVTIVDTGIGSGSNAIACHNLKYDLTACDIDKEYYEAAMHRLTQHQRQLTIF